MKINLDELKIRAKIIEGQDLKAIISIDFGDFSVKGFRVLKSQFENEEGEKLWITPPSYRDGGGKYRPIFYIPNKELWIDLKKKIYEEYHKASKAHYEKRIGVNKNQETDGIDPKDINF